MGSMGKFAVRGLYEGEWPELWEAIKDLVEEHGGYGQQDIYEALRTKDMQCHIFDETVFITQISSIRDSECCCYFSPSEVLLENGRIGPGNILRCMQGQMVVVSCK